MSPAGLIARSKDPAYVELNRTLSSLTFVIDLRHRLSSLTFGIRHSAFAIDMRAERAQYIPPMPPGPPGEAASFFSSGISLTSASVVSRSDAIDEAF